jgi:hypothetical protein
MARSAATGLARSKINRGILELGSASHPIGSRVRRSGGGRKSAVSQQPDSISPGTNSMASGTIGFTA